MAAAQSLAGPDKSELASGCRAGVPGDSQGQGRLHSHTARLLSLRLSQYLIPLKYLNASAPGPRLEQEHFHVFLSQGNQGDGQHWQSHPGSSWVQLPRPARGKRRLDYHNAVQTIRQGRGCRGWSHLASRGLASATRRSASRPIVQHIYHIA
jgi:hypothetical protein